MELDRPVFIGGTGRSGTSIMAKLLHSHPEFCLPGHENKLIVERAGLKDLVQQLGGRYDLVRNHTAIHEFVNRALRVRRFGFRDVELNVRVGQLGALQNLTFPEAFEIVQRENPQVRGSIHAVGQYFGLAHYDACCTDFVNRLTAHRAPEGIVNAEGLLKPFFVARTFTRAGMLDECRRFLDHLYAGPLKGSDASRWVDDTPLNFLHFDFLHELYPRMKFIHMIRDPRDVVSSLTKQVWFPSDGALALSICAAMLRTYRELKPTVPADSLLEVRLEDLVNHRDETLERVAAFLGTGNSFDADVVSPGNAHIGRGDKDFDAAVPDDTRRELEDWMQLHGYA
jgi:hypothetical protein